MPTVTDDYRIPEPVPFIDVEVTADNRLYIDPHAIRLRKSEKPFVDHALLCLDTFTEQVTKSILEGTPASFRRGEQLLQSFVEPWETRFGMSRRAFYGRGGSNIVGTWIWDVLTDDVEALGERASPCVPTVRAHEPAVRYAAQRRDVQFAQTLIAIPATLASS